MIEIGVANVVTPKGPKDYVTLASPSMAFSAGLIPEAILGVLKQPLAASGTLTPENFMTNSVFRQFLAGVIAKHGPDFKRKPSASAKATSSWSIYGRGRLKARRPRTS